MVTLHSTRECVAWRGMARAGPGWVMINTCCPALRVESGGGGEIGRMLFWFLDILCRNYSAGAGGGVGAGLLPPLCPHCPPLHQPPAHSGMMLRVQCNPSSEASSISNRSISKGRSYLITQRWILGNITINTKRSVATLAPSCCCVSATLLVPAAELFTMASNCK